ncbi:hypothetical protein [Labrys neptuniae]
MAIPRSTLGRWAGRRTPVFGKNDAITTRRRINAASEAGSDAVEQNAQGNAMAKPVDPIERVCRALCRHHGQLKDSSFDGKPIWESYRDEAMAIFWALKDGDWLPNGLVVRKDDRHSI